MLSDSNIIAMMLALSNIRYKQEWDGCVQLTNKQADQVNAVFSQYSAKLCEHNMTLLKI
jgi:hypothetical protein